MLENEGPASCDAGPFCVERIVLDTSAYSHLVALAFVTRIRFPKIWSPVPRAKSADLGICGISHLFRKDNTPLSKIDLLKLLHFVKIDFQICRNAIIQSQGGLFA